MRILEEALTFDDVLLVPAYSEILPREVDLSTPVTRRIRLNVPILSAAMDTVTEARLAITVAQEGGMGIIHKSMTVEAQAREVGRVKKFESGVIRDPITVSPNMSIREVLDLTRSRGISGVPVVVGRKAVVTRRVDATGGRVRIGGEEWSARAYLDDGVYAEGATVDVVRIEGATALVAG